MIVVLQVGLSKHRSRLYVMLHNSTSKFLPSIKTKVVINKGSENPFHPAGALEVIPFSASRLV